jgi:hypothetical protein
LTNVIVPLVTGWPSNVTVPLTEDLPSPQPTSSQKVQRGTGR